MSRADEPLTAVFVCSRLEVENINSDGHPLDLENAKVTLTTILVLESPLLWFKALLILNEDS